MKSRNIKYFKKRNALKVIYNPMKNDLTTFLNATLELSGSQIVKRHIRNFMQQLGNPSMQKMTA